MRYRPASASPSSVNKRYHASKPPHTEAHKPLCLRRTTSRGLQTSSYPTHIACLSPRTSKWAPTGNASMWELPLRHLRLPLRGYLEGQGQVAECADCAEWETHENDRGRHGQQDQSQVANVRTTGAAIVVPHDTHSVPSDRTVDLSCHAFDRPFRDDSQLAGTMPSQRAPLTFGLVVVGPYASPAPGSAPQASRQRAGSSASPWSTLSARNQLPGRDTARSSP